MAGFGTGFANTFVPSGRLALEKERMNESSYRGGGGGGMPAINMPIGGHQARAVRDYSHEALGGGMPAVPPPGQPEAVMGPVEQGPSVWDRKNANSAGDQLEEYETAIQALYSHQDPTLFNAYSRKWGNPELAFDIEVDDKGSYYLKPLKMEGGGASFDPATGTASNTVGKYTETGKKIKFKDFDELYLRALGAAKPRSRDQRVMNEQGVNAGAVMDANVVGAPKYENVGDAVSGLYQVDPEGRFSTRETAPPNIDAIQARYGTGKYGSSSGKESTEQEEITKDFWDLVKTYAEVKSEVTRLKKENLLDTEQGVKTTANLSMLEEQILMSTPMYQAVNKSDPFRDPRIADMRVRYAQRYGGGGQPDVAVPPPPPGGENPLGKRVMYKKRPGTIVDDGQGGFKIKFDDGKP